MLDLLPVTRYTYHMKRLTQAQSFLDAIFYQKSEDETVYTGSLYYPSAVEDSGYFCISTVTGAKNDKGKLSRAHDNLVMTYAVVLDDIGTKFPVPDLEPSAIIESSKGNYQYFYFLEDAIDPEEARELFQAMKPLGIGDPAAMTIGRIARLPNGVNGKKVDGVKNDFPVALVHTNYELRYDAQDLREAWNIVKTTPVKKRTKRVQKTMPVKQIPFSVDSSTDIWFLDHWLSDDPRQEAIYG